MKTLKYRSAFAGILVAGLSVFLFTACEKESDGPTPAPTEKISKFEKFKRLTFSGGNSTSTTSTSSGTFTGGGGSVSFSDAGASNGQYTSPNSGGTTFTDPQSNSQEFIVPNSFRAGGGTIQWGNRSLNVAFGLCADADIFEQSGAQGGDNLKAFIGIAGENLTLDNLVSSGVDSSSSGVELILWVFSYNGGTRLGDINAFNDDNPRGAFVLAFEIDDNGNLGQSFGSGLYFGTSGTASFGGSTVTLSNVTMTELVGEDLGRMSKRCSAALECVSFESLTL